MQNSQWLQIRQANPDYVILWGWGVMNAVAIKDRRPRRLPREDARRLVGGSEKTPSRPAMLPRATPR